MGYVNMAEESIDFIVGNMLTVEGRMNAINVAHESGIFIPDGLVVDVLGAERYSFAKIPYEVADSVINENCREYMTLLCENNSVPREFFSRAFVRRRDYKSAAEVFQHGHEFTDDAVMYENEGNLFLAMVRYEQAGNFGDANIVSGMLGNNPLRTRAYKALEIKSEEVRQRRY